LQTRVIALIFCRSLSSLFSFGRFGPLGQSLGPWLRTTLDTQAKRNQRLAPDKCCVKMLRIAEDGYGSDSE